MATDIARVMNLELKEFVKAGAKFVQIDEPYYSGFPEDISWGVEVVNTLVDGVDARIALHICYGNRYGKPSWEGTYRYLFPRIRSMRRCTSSALSLRGEAAKTSNSSGTFRLLLNWAWE